MRCISKKGNTAKFFRFFWFPPKPNCTILGRNREDVASAQSFPQTVLERGVFMVKWYPLRAELTKEDLKKLQEMYHFDAEALPEIERVYRMLLPRVHAALCWHLMDAQEKTAFESRRMPQEPCSEDLVAAILTLGSAVDDYIEALSAKGEVRKQYLADCIGNSLLMCAYTDMAKLIQKKTGRSIKTFEFMGSEYPIEQTDEIFRLLKQKQVQVNESYVMKPSKSVSLVIVLAMEETECSGSINICASCKSVRCPNRRES